MQAMSPKLVTHCSEMPVGMHRHDDARIIVFLEGTVQETDVFGDHKDRQGSVLFRPPFCIHANGANEATAHYLRLPIGNKALIAFVRKFGWRPIRCNIDLERRADRILLRDSHGDDFMDRLIGGQFAPSPDPPAGHENDLRVKILSERSIKETASEIDKKPYQMTRHFSRTYGFTPSAFRREMRLAGALKMLAATNEGLSQIAHRCGFSDQSHFSREIKAATGASPRAVREAMEA